MFLQVLQWTRDWKRAQELAWLVAGAYAQLLLEVESPLPGVVEWLQLMAKNSVPCALVRRGGGVGWGGGEGRRVE